MSHRLRDLSSRSIPSPIKRVRAKRTLLMSESDNNSSCDEEMLLQPQHSQSPDHGHAIKPTKKLVFDSPEKQESDSWSTVNKPPNINVMFCDDEDKNGRMTPPQSNSTPITKSHSSFTRYHAKPSLGELPPTPKSFKSSLFINNSHLHTSRDSSKVLISNIFSPEGMCIESAKRQYHIKRQRQLLGSFSNVDTKSPSTTNRTGTADDDSGDEHHPVFDIKSISSTSIDQTRYTLEFLEEDLLGSGDFGEVYKCLKYMDGMTYAVKRTKRPVANTAQEKIFKKEIHAHALLAHAPHIVNYFSSWSDQGVLYLQLEYCNGGNLENIIQNKYIFSEAALKQLLFQVSEGLRCMHEMRMIHMDIKPANILIVKARADIDEPVNTEKLHYKLGDFGHVIADNDFEVEEGDCRYLPKELLNNNFDNLSKVDIFALGLTLYEASGVTPLPKNGPMWHHIRDGNIEKLSNVSDDLYNLIKLMIDKDPTKRPTGQEIISLRSSPSCNCICCTRIDSSHVRDFDFKSEYIQKFIEQRTLPAPNSFHTC